MRTSVGLLATKNLVVGTGADEFLADARGLEVERIEAEIAALVPSGSTLAALPTGQMIGYLTRRPSPIRYVDFDPFVVDLYGEHAMLDALAARPPDFVVLVDASTAEYGPRGFGDGYAEDLAAWIGRHYEPVGETAGRWIVVLRRTA